MKNHVTSTVHATMGDTLHKIVTTVSNQDCEYQLWDKAQAIVFLSRTKCGANIIFFGDKNDTINALSLLIRNTNQWMNYMEKILQMGSVNGRTDNSQISVFKILSIFGKNIFY